MQPSMKGYPAGQQGVQSSVAPNPLGLAQTQTSSKGGISGGIKLNIGGTAQSGGLGLGGRTSLSSGLGGQTSLSSGLGQTSLSSGLGGQTSLSSGLGGQTSLSSGLGGQTSLNSGLRGQTSLSSGLGGQTSLSSGLGGQTSLSSGLGGQTSLNSGLGGQTSLNSGLGGQTSLSSGLGGQTSLNSGLGGQTSLNSGLGGQTSLNSGLRGQTSLSSGLGGQTSLSSSLGQTSLSSGLGGQTSLSSGLGGQTSLSTGLGGQTALSSGLGGQTSLSSGLGGQTSLSSGLGGQTSLSSGLGGQTSLSSSLGGQTSLSSGLGGQTSLSSGLRGQTSLSSGLGGQTSLSSGLGGQTSLSSGLGGQTSLSSGLGGQTSLSSGLGEQTVNGKPGSSDSGPVLDQELPPELNELVVKFVEHMKQQKDHQKQIMHFSDKNMKKVGEETRNIKRRLSKVHTAIQRDRQTSGKLKQDNHRTLEFAEIAQQTHEIPPSLQYENNAPMRYFCCVADDFESKMSHFSRQISELESHLGSAQLEDSLDPNLIVNVLQIQHKAFVTLAAQLQLIHEQVQERCSSYLQYRRIHLNDTSDVFSEKRKRKKLNSSREVKKGPSPFRVTQPLPLGPTQVYQRMGLGQTQPVIGQPALGQRLSMFNTPLHAGLPQATGLTSGQQLVSTGSTTRLGTPFPGPSSLTKAPPTVGLNQSKPLIGTSGSEFQLQPPPIAKKKTIF